MSEEKPWVYVILGATGSGRREVLADLLEAGLRPEDRAAVLLPATEPPHPADARLGTTGRWSWQDGNVAAAIPGGTTHLFLVADGRANPVDLAEKLGDWLKAIHANLARIITVVHCRLAEHHPEVLPWFEACIFYSDVVLLQRREHVANKWMSDFQNIFKKQFYPCLFEPVKAGRVKNPLELLEPEARRVSHLFDVDEWTGLNLEGVEFGESDEDDEDDVVDALAPKRPAPGQDRRTPAPEPDAWLPETDPYLQLDAAGRRKKIIPEIGVAVDAEAKAEGSAREG
jgi:hypothetical protein